MTALANSIQNGFVDYYNAIPNQTVAAMAKSFLISFTIATIVSGGNVAAGAVSGTLAASASLLHSLTTPLFKKMFDSPTLLGCWLRMSITVITVAALAMAGGYGAMVEFLPICIAVNSFILYFLSSRNLDLPGMYLVV